MTSGGLAAVSSSFFAALYSAFGKYDVVHIHAEGPAFFSWLPKMFGKRVVVTIHGIDWQREKWKSGFGSKFIRQGEKNAVKYADEIVVLGFEIPLLLNADAVFDVDFNRMVRFHQEHGGLVTLFTHPNNHPYDSGLIIAEKDMSVQSWLAKEDVRPTYYKNRVNAGLHVIDPKG